MTTSNYQGQHWPKVSETQNKFNIFQDKACRAWQKSPNSLTKAKPLSLSKKAQGWWSGPPRSWWGQIALWAVSAVPHFGPFYTCSVSLSLTPGGDPNDKTIENQCQWHFKIAKYSVMLMLCFAEHTTVLQAPIWIQVLSSSIVHSHHEHICKKCYQKTRMSPTAKSSCQKQGTAQAYFQQPMAEVQCKNAVRLVSFGFYAQDSVLCLPCFSQRIVHVEIKSSKLTK